MVAMEPIGQRLATGEMLLREVGRGALARVYLVSDGHGVRALKLLPVGQGARADHEHAIAHDLHHPHLGHSDARIDVGDRPGLIMPWVRGRAMRVRGRAPHDRLDYLAAFEGLLRALAHLHELRRVHRDVKPENVLVDAEGHVTLIDFDLAVSLDAPEAAPRAAGTVAYLSPEQARGERATPASDLYAAGIMLYAALTGEVPFHGTAAQRLAERHAAPAPRPSAVDPALASADALVGGLLAAAPARRFASADAASAALAELRAAWAGSAAGGPAA
jgi:eukaryotic-like serine/threonine-protein kinase